MTDRRGERLAHRCHVFHTRSTGTTGCTRYGRDRCRCAERSRPGRARQLGWCREYRAFAAGAVVVLFSHPTGALGQNTKADSTPADAAATTRAGAVDGTLVEADGGQPVPYGTVRIIGTPYERFTSPNGEFSLTGLAPGAYTLRAREIGYAPLDTTIVVNPGPGATTVVAHLRRFAWRLQPVVVRGDQGACVLTGAPDSTTDPGLAQIFSQLHVNVDRYRLLLDQYPFLYVREERRFFADSVWQVDTSSYESVDRQPYRVGEVVFDALDNHKHLMQFMYLPGFGDLADPAFLRTHCFSFGGTASDTGSTVLLRIDFAPATRIRTPDVRGSIYLDAKRYVVRRAEFHLTKPGDADRELRDLTATTTFRELFPLVPVIDSIETTRTVERSHEISQFRVEDDHLLDIEFEHRRPGD
jgi:Carboxypeptidase regulatory-like domain